MKKIITLASMLLYFVLPALGEVASVHKADGKYYQVFSGVSREHAQETASKMDAFFELFNSYFHFDEDTLEFKLKVRVFANKDFYDDYLKSIIGEKKEDFVYLQYSDPKRSELVGFVKEDDAGFNASLIRNGFIQFLKSFIPNPPLWIQSGFAIYFGNTIYDSKHEVAVYQKNLSWLDTLKSAIKEETLYEESKSNHSLIPLAEFLNPGKDTLASQMDIFYAQSWGVVMFLLNSENKNYNRIIWDSISALEPEATLEENQKAVFKKAFRWANEYLLYSDFLTYISSLKTFPELLKTGIELYSKGELEEAEEEFIQAILLNGNNYLPYYYLGLINYSKKQYSLAEYYYESARQLGADEALISYALGVNAFSADRLEDAREYLSKARETDPAKYEDRADKLLSRIDAMIPAKKE